MLSETNGFSTGRPAELDSSDALAFPVAFGVFNFVDVSAFIAAYNAGCA